MEKVTRYYCTVCCKPFIWEDNPCCYYGSLAIIDEFPSLAIVVCSDDCRKTATENLDSGKWIMPKITCKGYYHKITKTQKGYLSQEQLSQRHKTKG